MRIGIDAREIVGRRTGVGRYLNGLLRVWARAAERHDLILYTPPTVGAPWNSGRLTVRVVDGTGGTWWEQVRLPAVAAGDHLDAFFSPAYSGPLRLNVPLVVAMHDLSFFAQPEWFRRREGVRRRILARRAARRAAAIVTISEFSKREILERLSVEPSRIRVIVPGVDLPVAATSTEIAAGRTSDVAGERAAARVLYVGSIFNRRHVPDLIAAVAVLARRHRGVSLDIVGDNRTYPTEDLRSCIRRHDADGLVRWHEYVDEGVLAALYDSARAFAFLSEYEGLGLTPLEALAKRVPPLLLDTPVARESCGSAALYVPDTRPDTVATALERLLFDEALRARLLGDAPRVLTRYDWEQAGRATLDLLESVGR